MSAASLLLQLLLLTTTGVHLYSSDPITHPNRHRGNEEHQVRLIRDLLDNPDFDKRAIPVKGSQHPINVTMRMSLYQLVEVDEPRESIVLSVWMVQMWKDEYLSWDPAEYGNISWVVIPVEADGIFRVWRPDTTLYNGLEMSVQAIEKWICIELSMDMKTDPHRASIRFAHPAIYRFTCSLDVLYFPFDQQNCSMIFGSWVYDDSYVDYKASEENVNMEQFVPNEEWTLVSFKVYRHGVAFSCCPNLYPQLKYHFVIKRKPLYFICNLLIPIIIITLIAMVGFFSPNSTQKDRNEKITLGISTLLAMSILLLMVSDQMPRTATFIPIMGWFFILIIILISIAAVLTSYIISVQRRGRYGQKMTLRQRRLMFVILPQWLFMRVPSQLRVNEYGESEMMSFGEMTHETSNNVLLDSNKMNGSCGDNMMAVDMPNGTLTLSAKVDMIRRQINHIQQLIADQENKSESIDEWEWMANVLERLFLITFIILCLLISGSILLIGWLATM